MPFLGAWEGTEASWPNRHETLAISKSGDWAIYLALSYGNENDVAVETLVYDAARCKFELFIPMVGGGELVDVVRPDASTLQWTTHFGGPAGRTTLTLDRGKLHRTTELVDADGKIYPTSDLLLEHKGTAKIGFAP